MSGDFIMVGALVRNPKAPEWGMGQVQSIAAGRVTVNFENAGKLVLAEARVPLELVEAEPE